MMELQKRKLVQILLGFFLGRVSLFGINPIGIAFFASGYLETGIRVPLGLSVLLGMITMFPVSVVLCHMMVMLAVILMIDFLEKREICMQRWYITLLLSLALGVVTFFRVFFFPYDSVEKFATVIEGVLSVCATWVLYEGQHFLLARKKGQYPGNEELLSLVLLGMFVALGMPEASFFYLSPVRLMVYFVILVMGYCYGTGAGAMAGAIGGLCLLTVTDQAVMVGVMAFMGILAGLLRNRKKAVLCIGYFWGILLCSFFVGPGEFPYMDFGNAGISGFLFFCIPERIFGKARLHSGKWEDNWESEKLQELLRYKLADFSESFYHLSRVLGQDFFFGEEGFTEQGSIKPCSMEFCSAEQVSEVLAATSEQICGECERAAYCTGQRALLEPDKLSEISISDERGGLEMVGLPEDFFRECVRKEHFMREANQNIQLANTMHVFQNQIAYHRQAIAEQMKEIGEIIGDLSEQLPKVMKIPVETRENLRRELRQMRVRVGEMAFYEKYDGRMEIHIKGRTSRGRCVTAKEVEAAVSKVLKRSVRVLEECRKVFPMEMEEFVFIEAAVVRVETGISRASGNSGKISGDTFSCMQISGSEFLLALSDGMGSGEEAYTESERVIELIERMTEVGFSERAAVKLINSLYVTEDRNSRFATADITLLNLYQKTARFIKCGASTTYLYHGEELLAIEGEALPIGIMSGMEPYTTKSSINKGDYVIMMTDGVSDSFPADSGELQKLLESYIEQGIGAQEFSDRLLKKSVRMWNGIPQDDMSVLVVKLY